VINIKDSARKMLFLTGSGKMKDSKDFGDAV
jgi:hypothetical protein